jgi:triosephosphate isomerase
MTARIPLVAGNWKLHRTVDESVSLACEVQRSVPERERVEVVIAPVFTALYAVREATRGGRPLGLAAQDVFWTDRGAFTGEVSAPLLRDVGCTYAVVGHSERRQLFGERDEDVRRKVEALLTHDLTPIVCIGETLEQRERGETESVVLGQLERAIAGLRAEQVAGLVLAYEPVWAIGTGRTAHPSDAQAVHVAIRHRIETIASRDSAQRIRILYGGSVKPENAVELMRQVDIDGALVGGASLDAASFLSIIEAAQQAATP